METISLRQKACSLSVILLLSATVIVVVSLMVGDWVSPIIVIFLYCIALLFFNIRHFDLRHCIPTTSILIIALVSIHVAIGNIFLTFTTAVIIPFVNEKINIAFEKEVKKRINAENKNKIAKIFNLNNCTEYELIKRCKEKFTRDIEYKTERAIKHFILKLPHCEIDVNPSQSQKERQRMRNILK